jgi:hypothetical protein
MKPTRVTLMIYGNCRDRFIPSKYLLPGTRLYKEDGSYYYILNNKRENTGNWMSQPLDNGEYAGIDGSHISIEIDQEPIKGEIVYINKELSKLIFI